MSRTWRKIPKRSRRQPPRRRNKGGATASTGPSPERRRPDTDYDAETVHIAADLLEQASEILKQNLSERPQARTASRTPDARQALWNLVAEGEIQAEQLIPTLQMADRALKEVGEESAGATAPTLARAAAFLRTMANSETDHPSDPSKDTLVPDGRQKDTAIPFWRDSRATGLRDADHRRARRETRKGLADTEAADTVRTGKGRRYTDKYGDYHF